MAISSEEYWNRRSGISLVSSELIGAKAIAQTSRLYDEALKNINSQIQSLYANYSKKGILDVTELQQAIGSDGKARFLREIRDTAIKLGLNPHKIYDERYLSRLTRLEAVQEQLKLRAMYTAQEQERASTQVFKRVIERSYEASQKDLEMMGVHAAFTTLDDQSVNTILNSKWSGRNYSTSVWGNTENLALRLPTILGGAVASGRDYLSTSRDIAKEFKVSLYKASRLIRTETAYFHNQGELQSYIDDGIERYTLDVTLDGRTSDICLAIDESKVYLVEEASVGFNYPPLHTFCRTVPRAVLGANILKPATEKERFARFEEEEEEEEEEEVSLEQRWKQTMQKQMNPEKMAHDYNADMNIITQTYKGKELVEEIGKLMARVPANYPLRPALENLARLNGWH